MCIYSTLANRKEKNEAQKPPIHWTNNKRVGHRAPSLENWGGGLKILCGGDIFYMYMYMYIYTHSEKMRGLPRAMVLVWLWHELCSVLSFILTGILPLVMSLSIVIY